MPRPRLYQNQAQRQAAYRARHNQDRPPRMDRLASLAHSLHIVLTQALQQSQLELPDQVVGSRADETLENLIAYFDPNPDPVRYAGSPIYQLRHNNDATVRHFNCAAE